MGDTAEIHITPETPGRPAIRNPFESPNDYHRLHEPLMPSPSVFKSSTSSSATPAKFKWSIDEMANLLPVEIDPEDIHRQAVFFSQSRADAEIEEKRQHAIEQFFTKGAIVPSPWGPPAAKPSVKMPHPNSSLSPLVTETLQSSKKINAICQTVLSLPVDFNLEKVLGDYYKTEELTEQVQESLSSSSLRRKLFLDGHDSGSESSTPSSPDRYSNNVPPSSRETVSSVIVSPLQCGIPAGTPLSGQFSSSPIQGQGRAYSLGSDASPMFSERSSPAFKSPILSPIRLQHSVTPLSGERKRLSFLSRDGIPTGSSVMDMNRCGESPLVEGCSPIRSCSPFQSRPRNRACMWASPSHISPILQDKENSHPSEPLPPMDLDTNSTEPHVQRDGHPSGEGESEASVAVSEQMDQDEPWKDSGGNNESDRREDENEVISRSREESCGWVPEEDTASPARLSSSQTGSVPNAESTHMFAEGSITPYDISMQVDSGYNTHSVCTTSLMDTLSSDSQSKDMLDTHTAEEGVPFTKHTKPKLLTLPH
ncbi:protein aurora borealis [Carassius auratus]|uniref:Protein aurora borealis n=1 Tax=Carassius auratus TaxID=7957 RepID=A0A6P6JK91_CARAU|nr:protein aurora borealis-like [Carassius auratus]XP_026060144.1 protein aurora borealis-like [Carassius auratus]XP_026060145.1 protein aurora borealis-like [Carassius auratus]